MFSIDWESPKNSEVAAMVNTKTSALIDSCATAFKRTGLLRLAEEPRGAANSASLGVTVAQSQEHPGTYSVLPRGHLAQEPSQNSGVEAPDAVFQGNAALALRTSVEDEPASELRHRIPEQRSPDAERQPSETSRGAAVGLSAVDAFLPDGGLPTGKVTELVMSGGAAWGTRLALWACRAAQARAALTGTECWCAYIDPSGSLHARGVEATGVELSRLLVLRPTLEDVERVVLRLSEARVFSVIVVDLAGVPWAIRNAKHSSAAGWSSARWPVSRGTNKERKRALGSAEQKRQNWPRTVRQLALRLANTQAQVILLTEGQSEVGGKHSSQSRNGLPLPVALRVQMSSTRSGVSLQVVKEAQGRVGGQLTVPWGVWWSKSETLNPANDMDESTLREGRAKSLGVHPDRVQSLLRTVSPERQSREAGIPTVASSRFARSSRASL